jgi:hypothetical protein
VLIRTPRKGSLKWPNMAGFPRAKPKRRCCIEKQKSFLAQKKRKSSDTEKTCCLFVGKRMTKSGFSARGAKIGDMKTDGGYNLCDTCAHE